MSDAFNDRFHMPPRIGSPLSSRPMVRLSAPKICGLIDIRAYSAVFYIAMMAATGIHVTCVAIASWKEKGSTMFTVIFGMIGPCLGVHLIVYLVFLITGWMAIFMTNNGVHVAAKRYRVWCRVSRMFGLSWLITTSAFIMSCFFFREGMSVYENAKDLVRKMRETRGYKGTFEREGLGLARWIDGISNASPYSHLMFPYDFFMFCGYNLGVSITFLLFFPFLYILSFLWAQERYYRWRFFPNTKVPIE